MDLQKGDIFYHQSGHIIKIDNILNNTVEVYTIRADGCGKRYHANLPILIQDVEEENYVRFEPSACPYQVGDTILVKNDKNKDIAFGKISQIDQFGFIYLQQDGNHNPKQPKAFHFIDNSIKISKPNYKILKFQVGDIIKTQYKSGAIEYKKISGIKSCGGYCFEDCEGKTDYSSQVFLNNQLSLSTSNNGYGSLNYDHQYYKMDWNIGDIVYDSNDRKWKISKITQDAVLMDECDSNSSVRVFDVRHTFADFDKNFSKFPNSKVEFTMPYQLGDVISITEEGTEIVCGEILKINGSFVQIRQDRNQINKKHLLQTQWFDLLSFQHQKCTNANLKFKVGDIISCTSPALNKVNKVIKISGLLSNGGFVWNQENCSITSEYWESFNLINNQCLFNANDSVNGWSSANGLKFEHFNKLDWQVGDYYTIGNFGYLVKEITNTSIILEALNKANPTPIYNYSFLDFYNLEKKKVNVKSKEPPLFKVGDKIENPNYDKFHTVIALSVDHNGQFKYHTTQQTDNKTDRIPVDSMLDFGTVEFVPYHQLPLPSSACEYWTDFYLRNGYKEALADKRKKQKLENVIPKTNSSSNNTIVDYDEWRTTQSEPVDTGETFEEQREAAQDALNSFKDNPVIISKIDQILRECQDAGFRVATRKLIRLVKNSLILAFSKSSKVGNFFDTDFGSAAISFILSQILSQMTNRQYVNEIIEELKIESCSLAMEGSLQTMYTALLQNISTTELNSLEQIPDILVDEIETEEMADHQETSAVKGVL